MSRTKKLWLILMFLIFCAVFAVYYINYKKAWDTKAPVLKCETEEIIASVKVTEEELLKGVTATDNVDGDLTDEILIEEITQFAEGVRTIRYAVVDSANNIGRISRTLIYEDYESPKFALEKPLVFYIGDGYDLIGIISASDVLDGDITFNVRLTADTIEYQTPGVFEVSYAVRNSAGDYVTLTANVEMREKENKEPRITLTEALIYLKQGEAFSPLDYVDSVYDPNMNYGLSREEQKETYTLSNIDITNPVDTNVPGTYEVIFHAPSDNPEYTGVTRLIVIVEEG